jgi:hypothetical protein
MKRFTIWHIVVLSLVVQAFGIRPSPAVEISGTIDSDTTWTSDETILVTGDVTVAASGSLTIEAGSEIYFGLGRRLFVAGHLAAEGEHLTRIVFTTVADTAGGSPLAGSWNGILFGPTSDGWLWHCDVRYAGTCVYISQASPTLDGCVIEGFNSSGIYVQGVTSVPAITPAIMGCAIEQRRPGLIGMGTGIYARQSMEITISGCSIRNCSTGFDFYSVGSAVPAFQVVNCDVQGHVSNAIYTHGG